MNLIRRIMGKKKNTNNKGTFYERSLVEIIAETCHEVNRAYCKGHGDNSHKLWKTAPKWQKDSAIKGVEFRIQNPYSLPSASHDSWMAQKIEDGWTYGEIKSEEYKTHPCMVGYNDLPLKERIKDTLFTKVVDSFI